mgnify:CR=1 FL=1
MSATLPQAEEGAPIAAVEQATGIARATLRIWERRYGFPQPGRDLRGERSYPEDQVRKLRLIADLMARGHRPGRLVALSDKQLAALAGPAGVRGADDAPARVPGDAADEPVLAPLMEHDAAALTGLLEQSIGELGLAGFVTERMPQMNVNVGLAWQRGEIEVYEEHLYTEVVQQVLRGHMARLAPAEGRGPRVLLATFPDESHTLGLLMAQVLLMLQGCRCTSLGARVPVGQLVLAARVFRADVVGLSFTASTNPSHVLRGLEQLRGELGPQVAIWAGGSSPALGRQRVAGVQVMRHIRDVLPALAHWHANQGLAA